MAEIDGMIYSKKLIQHYHNLEIKFIPPNAWKSDPLTLWRERIIFFFFFFAAVFAPFALIPSSILSFNEGLWGIFILDFVAYIIVLVVLFSKKISLKQKTWVTFLIFYFLGTGLLFIIGFYGGGYIWLFGAALIVGAMIGIKAANIALFVNFLSLVSIGVYIAVGSPEWASAIENPIQKWAIMTTNFMFINILVTLLVATMLNSLKIALTKEQKSAKEKIEANAELDSILDRTPNIIFKTDHEGKITFINKAIIKYGYIPNQIIGREIKDLIHPDDHESVDCRIKEKKTGSKVKIRLVNAPSSSSAAADNNHEISIINTFLVNTEAIYKDNKKKDKNYIGLQGIARDITKEGFYIKQLSQFGAVIEQVDEEVIITDSNGIIQYVNPSFEQNTGYSSSETLGKKPSLLKSGLHDDDFYKGLWTTILDKRIWKGKIQNKRKNGAIVLNDVSITPILDPSDQISAFVSIRRDITKQMEMEKQIQQSQKMEDIGKLAGGIAHDFNNILSGIFGYSQLAQMNLDKPVKAKEQIDHVIKGAQRATELVQQILTFSRQTEYQKQPLMVYLEVNEALKLLRSSIPSTIEIKANLNSKALVLADPTKIHQVIMNLSTNAYHAMRKTGGLLTVSLRDAEVVESKMLRDKKFPIGKYLKLEVSDTGHGMDEKTLEKAFDPYYTTKKVGQGTGLGLALVQAIVDEHDSYLDVYSKIDYGTTFHIYFPIVEKKVTEEPMEAKVVAFKGNETIMVVDDEETIQQILKEFLETCGYKVSLFPNGIEALEKFESNPSQFDLIITDMTMPGMAGDELSKKILKIRADIPIILCTGFSENISKTRAIEIGIREFIKKPIANLHLVALIRKVLDKTS